MVNFSWYFIRDSRRIYFTTCDDGNNSDTMDIIVASLPFTYLICIMGTLFLSLIIMAIVSKRLKNIDMVGALKAKE